MNSFTVTAISQIDLWVLGFMASESEVALYGAASRVASLATMPLMVFGIIVGPFFADYHPDEKPKECEAMLRKGATIAGLPSFAILGLLCIGAPWFLTLLAGEYYSAGASILIILAIGHAASIWTGAADQLLLLTNKQRLLLNTSLLATAILVALGLLFSSLWQGVGIAIAVTLSRAVQRYLLAFFVLKAYGISASFSPRIALRILRHPRALLR
ncbi:MAG: hypothetical protein IPJ88_12985 [Myxococcales bacterium]|nr:MAG: hypothetical protein IPJ88_12985 [Myxococcales bacterium]